MPSSAKRRLAAGAVGFAVLAGTGGAYAAAQSATPTPTPTAPSKPKIDPKAQSDAFLNNLAKRLNITRDQLDAALKGAGEDTIDAAVAAGTITKEQGDEAKKALANGPGIGLGGLFGLGHRGPGGGPGGPGGPGFGGRGGFGFFGPGADGNKAAADYLGLTQDKLREQLEAGKSLADVAKATSGKTVDGLKAAIKDATVKNLDQAVKDGKLTSDQRDKIVSGLDARLDDIVNNTPPKGGPGRPGFRHP